MKKGLLNTLGLTNELFSTNFILIFLILVFSVITITPIAYTEKYMMVLWTVLFLSTIKSFNKSNIKLRKILFLGVAFVFLCTAYWVLGISSATLAYCMPKPFLFFAPIVGLILIDQCDNHSQISFLFHFLSLAIAINITDSIWITRSIGIENMVYQNLAESLGENGYTGLNLGGSMFVNMIVFYATLMFLAFINATQNIEKVLFLIYFSISAYFIIFCSLKASAILLLLVAILLQYISNKGKKNFWIIFFLSVFLIGILYAFRDNLINLLIDIIDSERVTSRLEVFATGANVTDNSSFAGRENLFILSLQSWLRDPETFVFGIGDHNWEDFSSTIASGVGNHSDLVDVLARYGIVGGIILYSSLAIYYNYLKENFGAFFKVEIFSFFILILFMGLSKKFITGEPAIAIFLLFPLCLKYFALENERTCCDEN